MMAEIFLAWIFMSIYANIQFNENQTTKLDSFKARILELEFCRKLSQIRQLIQDEKLPTCYIIAARSENLISKLHA
ncbi:MAG: hypothetical protein HWD59_00955 [Coxiellaceae bacterium]|nr:MAG: hypothetical protein HWD59_00955 [Coxiellaceae bacterium]